MSVTTPEELARRAGTHLSVVQLCRKSSVPLRKQGGDEPRFALALSGGGFRASLSALGVLRFFASANLLSHVSTVSSVSGGSVTNGLFAVSYRKIEASGFTLKAFDEAVTDPLLSYITSKSMTRKLIMNSWKAIGPPTRTTILANALDQWFYDGAKLHDLSETCDFVINATNLNSGVRFGFKQYSVGDYTLGFVKPRDSLLVAEAVAASAAVPGVFAPFDLKGHKYPCDVGYPPKLVDGGVYDNLGIEPIKNLESTCLVVLNAGGVFRVGKLGPLPIVGALARSNSVMYRQSSALRMRDFVDRYKQWERNDPPPSTGRQGVIFCLGTTFKAVAPKWLINRPNDVDPSHLEGLPTSFSRFSLDDAVRLIYRGWWLTGASLATFHPSVISDLPAVPPMPQRTHI